MAKLCPGQDTRFWRPEDIFEIPCVSCGKQVEFFKDDVYRRCQGCGRRVENPKFSLGCAKWCEHAKACLGYDPAEAGLTGSDGESLVDKAIEALGAKLGENTPELAAAVRAAEFAREIVGRMDADPKSVLLGSLLAGTVAGRPAGWAKEFLESVGVHWSVADRAGALASRCCQGTGPETQDEKAVHDAVALAAGRKAEADLHTRPGREIARRGQVDI